MAPKNSAKDLKEILTYEPASKKTKMTIPWLDEPPETAGVHTGVHTDAPTEGFKLDDFKLKKRQADRLNARKAEQAEKERKAFPEDFRNLKASYVSQKNLWNRSAAKFRLKQLLNTTIRPYGPEIKITDALLFAVGSFSKSVQRMCYLVAFEHWVKVVSEYYHLHHIYVQGDALNDVEKYFVVEQLGFEVLDSSECLAVISETTFLVSAIPGSIQTGMLLSVAHPKLAIMPAIDGAASTYRGLELPHDPVLKWISQQDKVKGFYYDRNYTTLVNTPMQTVDLTDSADSLCAARIFYSVLSGGGDTKLANLLNESNLRLKKFYSRLPDPGDLDDVMELSVMAPSWVVEPGIGKWKKGAGFVLDKHIMDKREEYAQARASEKQLLVADQA